MKFELTRGATIALQSAVFGDALEVNVPLVRMTSAEAIEMAQALIYGAHLLKDRELLPENRVLLLSEELSLDLSDSFESDLQTPACHRAGVTFSDARA